MFPIDPQPEAGQSVVVEGAVRGKPHAGKVLAAIQPHADDVPLYCGGTIGKLIEEGYTAYLIQTTNDENCGPTRSIGETILQNEREVDELGRVLGFKRVFNLGYRNHRMDGESPLELRARLIFLFRVLKVDTLFTFNPWGHWEENPDHWFTATAVEAARWMAGMDKDYPEHFAAGIEPHAVTERYYWVARHHQPYNRVVDVSAHVETKVAGISVNKAQGPGGSTGSRLKAHLAARNLRLPELDGDAEAADRAYIRRFLLTPDRELGAQYGIGYAEPFYYFGPETLPEIDEYVARNAVPLK
ncbi:MAG TPA: PIG-L family deacetylase [Chloroflexota bacterium]|nr:PIG-L family deacetylase [Chloroflexota bacterium]